jgi:hypothetical protein
MVLEEFQQYMQAAVTIEIPLIRGMFRNQRLIKNHFQKRVV